MLNSEEGYRGALEFVLDTPDRNSSSACRLASALLMYRTNTPPVPSIIASTLSLISGCAFINVCRSSNASLWPLESSETRIQIALSWSSKSAWGGVADRWERGREVVDCLSPLTTREEEATD